MISVIINKLNTDTEFYRKKYTALMNRKNLKIQNYTPLLLIIYCSTEKYVLFHLNVSSQLLVRQSLMMSSSCFCMAPLVSVEPQQCLHVVGRLSEHRLSFRLSTETLMDSTTATAELGWTVYPVSGSSDNSVSGMLCFHSHLLLIMPI